MLDLIDLQSRTVKGNPYKYSMIVQNVNTGYIFAEPLKTNKTAGEEGTAAAFNKMLADARALSPPQGRS